MERILASSPLLSPNEAHAVALSLTTAYVGGLYISRLSLLKQNATKASYTGSKNGETPLPDLIETESANELDRDDPKVIKSRIRAVSLATLGGCAAVGAIIYYRGDVKDLKASTKMTLRYLGLPNSLPPLPNYPLPSVETLRAIIPSPTTIKNFFTSLPTSLQLKSLRPLLPYSLAPALFLGPLFVQSLDRSLPGQKYGRSVFSIKEGGLMDTLALCVPEGLKRLVKGGRKVTFEEVSDLVEKRRWIEMRNYIAGPITEEIVFRSCLIVTYLLADYNKRSHWKFLTFVTPLWFGLAHAHHAYEVYKKGGKTRQSLLQASVSAGFQFTYTTLFGWYAAYLFVKTDSILPSIASHIFCNMMGLPDPVAAVSDFPSMKGPIIGAHLAGIGAFVYGLRQL